MANRTKRTPERVEVVLSALASGATVAAAATAAGVGRATLYEWAEDAEFRAEMDAALDTGTDLLEAEAVQRALLGSDQLLMFLLRGRRPERYGTNVKLDARLKADVEVNLAHRIREANVRRREFGVIDGKAS